jgi:hypothetical protein
MQVLSATDALSPAVERTKSLLFRPFRWGTFLKLCAVAIFTEGLYGNFNFSSYHHTAHVQPSSIPLHFSPAMIAVILAILLFVLVLATLLFYLCVRLRFALFDCLIHLTRQISPGWRRYRAQAHRYFLLSIAIGIAFLAGVALISLPFVFAFLRFRRECQITGRCSFIQLIGWALPLVAAFLLVILTAIAVDMILRDFMLPHIALEDASVGQAWAAVHARISREKGAFLLYAVLRIFIPLAAMVAMVLVLAIPCLIVFGGLVLALAALHAAFAGATGLTLIFGAFSQVLVGLIIMTAVLFVAISFGGPLCIAIRNYSLLFYGGRYQALGDILWPSSPAVEPGTA